MNRLAPVLIAAILVSACANLKEVRDYAGESAKFSAYTDLTTRFRDTFQRELPYLSGDNLTKARETDKGRNTIYPDLIKVHERVTLYLKTLAKLAGDETFDLSKPIGAVGDALKANPNYGFDAKQVDAYTDLGKILARWATASAQQRAVRDMVRDGNADFQTLLDAMKDLVRLYRKTHDQEKAIVLGFFDVEIPFTTTPKDKLLAVLARAHIQAKQMEYNEIGEKYPAAEEGIKKISEGHMSLYRNVNEFSNEELKTLINNLSQEIKGLREQLQTIRS
jgi:methyl-accepting chemotaxis protein